MYRSSRAVSRSVSTLTAFAVVLMPFLASVPVAHASSQEYGTLVLELYIRGGSSSFDEFRYDVDSPMMGARGRFVASGTTTFDGIPAGQNQQFMVTGQTPEGYTLELGGDCDADGVLTIPGGGTGTCELIATAADWQEGGTELGPLPEDGGIGGDSAEAEAFLNVEAAIYNGWLDDTKFPDFGFRVGSRSYVFEADGANQLGLDAGDYSVREVPAEGYVATYSGDCDQEGNVALAADDASTCRITYALSVGGFNPGGEPIPPAQTPAVSVRPVTKATPAPVSTTASGSPALSASPSDANGLVAAINAFTGGAPCASGSLLWIILNAVLFVIALQWLIRTDGMRWQRSLVTLAVLAALMSRWGASCTGGLRWLPVVLAATVLLRLWLRGRKNA